MFGMLLTVVTVTPEPLVRTRRALLRMSREILTWRHAVENIFGKRNVCFLEIDMNKFAE